MLATQKKYLFDLYKQHDIDFIDSNCCQEIATNMNKTEYAELKEDKDFNGYNLLLKKCRLALDSVLVYPDDSLQTCSVLEVLARITNQVNEEEYTTYLAFFKETVYPKWKPVFRECFDFAVKELIGRRQVFISYTNRNARLNNSLYRGLLDQFLESELLSADNLNKKNLIVWVIKQQLIDVNQLTGYFDQDKNDYEYGLNLPATLQNFCTDSITFLQFLEKKTFDKATSSQRNYCFDEYQFFSTGTIALCNKINSLQPAGNFFIVRSLLTLPEPGAVYPVNFPEEYAQWKQTIDPLLYFKLYSNISINEFLCELEKIAGSIKRRSDELLLEYHKYVKSLN